MRRRRAPRTANPISPGCGCAPIAGRPDEAAARAREAGPDARGRRRRRRGRAEAGRGQAPAAGAEAGRAERTADPPAADPFAGGRGGVSLEPATPALPLRPKGPPVATFFEAGGNMEGGLPYTPWAAELRKQRWPSKARDNPDAMCLPMGFLQFHQQPQPRKIVQTRGMILIE